MNKRELNPDKTVLRLDVLVQRISGSNDWVAGYRNKCEKFVNAGGFSWQWGESSIFRNLLKYNLFCMLGFDGLT
jgi:hypothetical protein